MNSAKKFNVGYYQGARGYIVEIDPKATVTQMICRVSVLASSRKEALQNALKALVERNAMTAAGAALYARHIKAGSKSVQLACAKH